MEVSKNDIDEVCSVLGIDSETKRLTASLISQCGGSSRAPQQEDLSPSEVAFRLTPFRTLHEFSVIFSPALYCRCRQWGTFRPISGVNPWP